MIVALHNEDISDYRMPRMNGLELVREIRGNEQYRSIPIVMISAENDPETVRQAST